jgi:ribokinase
MNNKILALGGIFYDFYAYTERFPHPGESVFGHNFVIGFGGKCSSAGVIAAKLGGSVQMIGMVGQDEFGDACIKNLKSSGMNTDFVSKTERAQTAIAVMTVKADGRSMDCVSECCFFRRELPGCSFGR